MGGLVLSGELWDPTKDPESKNYGRLSPVEGLVYGNLTC